MRSRTMVGSVHNIIGGNTINFTPGLKEKVLVIVYPNRDTTVYTTCKSFRAFIYLMF